MTLLTLVVIHLVVVGLVSLFLYTFQPNTTSKVLARAFKGAEHTSHFVTVYENSTASVVDKLLVVNPYGWILWNYDGRLFVMNPEAGTGESACPRGVGVFEVSSSINLTFTRRCVNVSLVDLVAFYQSRAVRSVVPFEPTKVYTVLDLIELLSIGVLWINTDGTRNKDSAVQVPAQELYDSLYKVPVVE